jgi:TonB family protein
VDLRALLFTADGSSSATLCQVLTDLGIAAEICSEVLVAVERVGRENYDALIVDWDHESEATLLLKNAREHKSFSLNLALVPDEAAIGRALQQGANSVIRKPVDPIEAHDTLSTARELILSRRTEQRDKQARLTASQAEGTSAEKPLEESSAPKAGFLQQTMTRSALEAEEKVGKVEMPASDSGWQAARGPASLREQEANIESRKIEPVSQKRWDDVKSIFRDTPKPEEEESEEPVPEVRTSQDSTGVFSSLPEPSLTTPEAATSSLPQYLVFAMVGCVLIAGVLYVWAPGDSYLGRMSSAVRSFSAKAKPEVAPANSQGPAVQPVASLKPTPDTPARPEVTPDPAPIDTTDVDPSKIQIIETKAIPKAGAQQPPSYNPPPDSDQAKALAQAQSPPQPSTGASESNAAVDLQLPAEPVRQAPAAPRSEPAKPVLEAVPTQRDTRVGVIIPDSLRTTPAPSPASSLETFSLPEETSQTLLIHKVDPDYPPQAAPQHLEGAVVLQAWIAKDGTVRDLKLVKGYFILARAAFDAVKQWRFKPFVQDGRVVEFQTTVTLNFKSPK